MDNNNLINKSSSKYFKKTTKFISCDKKIPRLRNFYHFGTEKLLHHNFKVTDTPKERYPEIYQIHPELHRYVVIKRSIALKRQNINKNTALPLQEHPCRDKKIYIDKLIVTRNEAVAQIKNLKKKYPAPKHPKFFVPCVAREAVNNKNFDAENVESRVLTRSQPDICIVNNYPLLFGCSADSLQLHNSKNMVSIKTTETTLDGNIPSWQKKENWKTVENCCSNESRIIPHDSQDENNIMVYRVIESCNGKQAITEYHEDNTWSSMSTCSSSSSTREYYLPAVSGSTDTIQVAEVLTEGRILDWAKYQEDVKRSKKTTQIKRNIVLNNRKKKKAKKVCIETPFGYEKTSLNNETHDTNAVHKKNKQFFAVLEGNDGLFPFFLLNNLCNEVIKKKLQKLANDNKIHEGKVKNKSEDKYDSGSITNNRSISKENIENNRQNHDTTCVLTETNSSKFKTLKQSLNTTEVEVINQELKQSINGDDKKPIIRRSIFNISCRPSNSKCTFYENRKTKSEDYLLIMNTRGAKEEIQNRKSTKKIKSSSCFTNSKSNILDCQLKKNLYPSISNDSFNISKRKFIKLDPFFDIDFKDPKISRLIIPSTILADESNCGVNEKENDLNEAELNEKKGKETIKAFFENIIKNHSYIKVKSSDITNISLNNFKNDIDESNSNNAIVFTDSIINGGGAFQKIKEKFDNFSTKKEVSTVNKPLNEYGSMSKDGGILDKEMKRENSGHSSNSKYIYQPINSKEKNNIKNECTITTNSKNSINSSKINILSLILEETNKQSPILSKSMTNLSSGIAHTHKNTHENNSLSQENAGKFNIGFSSFIEKLNDKNSYLNHSEKTLEPLQENKMGPLTTNDITTTSEKELKSLFFNKCKHTTANKAIQVELLMNVSPKQEDKETEMTEKDKNINDQPAVEVQVKLESAKLHTNKFTKGKIMMYNEQPIILYNSSGYPVTDLNGRLLKNNLGAYLLSTDKYDEILKKNVPVFDCELRSASNNSFNPTKKPSECASLKITDRGGNPISLYNNLGLPLTDEDGGFLHDNCGTLLVKMDNYNFPICCSNGSPVYLQNGAMLLSQKYKFIITLLNTESSRQSGSNLCAINYLKRQNITNKNGNNSHNSDKHIKDTTSMPYKNNQSEMVSKSQDFISLNFQMNKKEHSLFERKLLTGTEVPEFVYNQQKAANIGGIPQSPIPIFDLEGNRLTDENGYPLKNKYGEYMLLLDKNGFAISDSCGGPIFNAEGKQLLLKDMYQMYKPPLNNFSWGTFVPIEYPFKHSKSIKTQNIGDNSEEEIPLLDLKFENHHHSEPIMNYLGANKIYSYNNLDVSSMDIYNMDVEEVGWIKNEIGQLMEHSTPPELFSDCPMSINHKKKKQLLISPIKSKDDGSLCQIDNYDVQREDEEFYEQCIEENNYFIPYSSEQYVNQQFYKNQHQQQDQLYTTENMYLYKDDYFYYDSGMSGTDVFKDLNVQYCTEDEEYFIQY